MAQTCAQMRAALNLPNGREARATNGEQKRSVETSDRDGASVLSNVILLHTIIL